MDEIQVGDTIEVIKNLEEHESFHDFTIGRQYKVNEIYIVCHNTKLYILNDFHTDTGNIFEQGVYRDEIKFIKKGK